MTLNEDHEISSSNSDEEQDYPSHTDDDENEDIDKDDIEPLVFDDSKEIYYTNKYKQIFEEVVSLDDVYILNLDAQKFGQSVRVAIALSNFTCKIYDFDDGNKSVGDCLEHKNKIADVKFGSGNNQLSSIVYTASEDGTIKLWDLRLKEKCVSVFKDDSDACLKPLSCFDISCDGRFLVAGTDVLKDDAFLLFWDVRSTNLLGGYWDSHQNDITQVKFHPTEDKTVISGSVDGIINLFDVTQTTENEALQLSLNTNSSISNLKWLKSKNGDSVISCITNTEDVQLWYTTDSSPYITISRDTISNSMNLKPDVHSQVINCHQTDQNGNCMLLVGNNHGKGEHLQSLNINGHELTPRTLFKNNKQIIRCSWYDYNSGVMITGGEAGILSIWDPSDEIDVNNEKCSLKSLPKVSLKKSTTKPY
ncbi:WD40/YVTN repeat-like-containing domain,WD40 repeat, conserved site,WD40 repeat,WD40-repeat-containing [Cinara cedri]|uniref:WD repeat-containing protein 89 n=1 Tax=Cinara cedri TaxID=506608 RepID=A0A5E4MVW3_9HEMI|nr:WD40/YVTN repeat-like-containing domain,WD40 repeat, conserved site,WD40 repeat,WD40-repeat-containing [Cinara cedri]